MKRYLSSLLAICLLLTLLPAMPTRAEKNIAWPTAAGTPVTIDGNDYQFQGETSGGIDIAGTAPSAWKIRDGGYVLWDGDATVVLHEVVITEGGSYYRPGGSVRFGLNIHSPSTICLEGDNKITLSATDQDLYALFLSSSGEASRYTIQGDSLTVAYTGNSVNKANLNNAAVYCAANLTVDGIDLTVTGEGKGTNKLLTTNYDLTIKNHTKLDFSINQKNATIYGIEARNLYLCDSTATISIPDTTSVTYGLFAFSQLTAERSDIRVAIESSDNAFAQGICSWSTLTVIDSDIQVDIKSENDNIHGLSASYRASIEQSKVRVRAETTEFVATGIGDSNYVNIEDSVLDFELKSSATHFQPGHTIGINGNQISASNSILKFTATSDYSACGISAVDSITLNHCAAELALILHAPGETFAPQAYGLYYGGSYNEAELNLIDSYLNITGATNAISGKSIPESTGMVLLKPENPIYREDLSEHESAWYQLCDGETDFADSALYVTKQYTDVSADQWYMPAVFFVTERGLFIGINETEFSPDGRLTRAQMMTILARMANEDVTPDTGEIWYTKALNWAMSEGISDGTNPDDFITREQMITMVWRYLGKPEGNGDLTVFTDRNKIDSWAKDALQWAVKYRVISGKGNGILDPDGPATRAEAAQLIKNFIINY